MELKNKTVVFLGSSVTEGSASNGWSMCECVRETLGCTAVKWAVSGTTLADIDDMSYVSRFLKEIDAQEKCDHFICQLSTNDANKNLPLGKIGETKNKDAFDTKTIIGAIEFIIAMAKEKWGCPVSFYTGTYFESEAYQNMVDALRELSKKWDVGIIDLWDDKEMRNVNPEDYAKYMHDNVHPNKIGYAEWWGPKFIEYLKNNM